jgi:hypothetical protein
LTQFTPFVFTICLSIFKIYKLFLIQAIKKTFSSKSKETSSKKQQEMDQKEPKQEMDQEPKQLDQVPVTN